MYKNYDSHYESYTYIMFECSNFLNGITTIVLNKQTKNVHQNLIKNNLIRQRYTCYNTTLHQMIYKVIISYKFNAYAILRRL